MSARLTDRDRILRSISEADWQRTVTDTAELYGWQWVHWRPARTTKGWRTPVEGPLGAGWVDLVLTRPYRLAPWRAGEVVFIELKSQTGQVPPEQLRVHVALMQAGQRVLVLRPGDMDQLLEVLR